MASGGLESTGFAVEPKRDCPHVELLKDVASLQIDVAKPCESCENVGENWVCLSCSAVKCSRYVKSHMVDHNAESNHPLALSFSDLSVWCYGCDSYISSPNLQGVVKAAELAKYSN